ncbi:hypothetical protein DAMA08_009670 [Martiniozyma asiatica (nom. inval.)]|nr:hypothetical protein DAMA08_009670 [Martiniozyma asiatica]
MLIAAVLPLLATFVSSLPLEIYSNDIVLSDDDFGWTKPTLSEKAIINSALDTLENIDNSDMSQCNKCKSRLIYGKALSLSRPDLIPEIFEKWCNTNSNFTSSFCAANYHRNTADNSTTGTNFADMLTLINPASVDAEYWCHYKSNKECALPELPKDLSISNLWNNTKPKKAYESPQPGNDTFNVLHISDFHIEWEYSVGAEANCSDSICCTPHTKVTKGWDPKAKTDVDELYTALFSGSFIDVNGDYHVGDLLTRDSNISIPATTFGYYECDAPEILINSSLHDIADYQKKNNMTFEFALFTGDMVDHDELSYISYERTIESEEICFRDVKNTLGDMPVYSVMGNHDSFPYGQLAPEKSGFSSKFDWNSDLMAEMWLDYDWLDWQDAQIVKTHYAGYSVNTKRGLKVIAFNSNAWYQKNEYAYINTVEDPDYFGVFEFIVNELLDAEANDQRVWLMHHIPMSQTMMPPQAKLYTQMLERFSPYTIGAIFTGHTHRDEFQILYSGNDGTNKTTTEENVVNFEWIVQAVTPAWGNNPAWRYYEVDTETFSIMNSHNFFTALNETFTSSDAPVWQYEYSAREAYNVDWPETAPLNGTFWHKVSEQIWSNTTALQQYENYAHRFSPYTPDCINDIELCEWDLCYVRSFLDTEYSACLKHYNITDESG